MMRWIALAVLFYLALLVIKLPAQFILALVDPPKPLQISGVDGTIWKGQAHSASWQGHNLDQLSWQLSATALLTGKLELQINAGDKRSDIQFNGIVGMNASGGFARDLFFEFPAAMVKEFYPLPVELNGRLKGLITEASQGTPWCETLDGQINWLEPAINSKAFGQNLTLDQTQAKLRCEDGNLAADITDEGQVLGLNVSASLSANDYLLTGEMKPGDQFPSQFKQGLMFFASPWRDTPKFTITRALLWVRRGMRPGWNTICEGSSTGSPKVACSQLLPSGSPAIICQALA